MTAAELKALDDKRREREDELVLLLLLLLGYGVGQSLAGNDTGNPPVRRLRREAGVLLFLDDLLRTQGVDEIAGSMADAHLDGFAVYQPSAASAPSRESLIAEYRPAAGEMADAMLEAIAEALKQPGTDRQPKPDGTQQGQASALADALLAVGYSRSDSSGLELGAERQIVTASNAGIIAGGLAAMGSRVTGLRHRSVIDDRTTKICTERNGLQLPAEDPYWLLNWPSLHWRCRSTIELLIVPFKASTWRPRTPPDVGFGRAPASVRRLLKRLAA